MAKSKREMVYVNLYLEKETVEALDDYAETFGFSRSNAANNLLAAEIRDDVPISQTIREMVSGFMAKRKAERESESLVALA